VNSQVVCLVQIETRLAMENLDEILSTDGVDGVYVGPADLSLSHGLLTDGDSPELVELLVAIAGACARHDRYPASMPRRASTAVERSLSDIDSAASGLTPCG